MIHRGARYHLPASLLLELTPEESITYLFWDGEFTFEERCIHGVDAIADEMRRYVAQHIPRTGPRRLAFGLADATDRWRLFTQKLTRMGRRLKGK
jgi:hypothetical protein